MPEQKEHCALSCALIKARSENRLGVMLYVIPGFPTIAGYRKVMELLEDTPWASIIENTLPVDCGFSELANPYIKNAHMVAYGNFGGAWPPLQPFDS